MVNSFQPESWGGRYTSKDYELFMEGSNLLSTPISLLGSHAVTGFNQNLTDPVTRRFTKKVNGRAVDFEETIRPAQQLSLTATLFFGNAFSTPALSRARKAGGCKTTFYAVALCPEDTRFEHAYIFPQAYMNPPARVNDFITLEDTVTADWQTEIRMTQELVIQAIGSFRVKTNGAALYAITYLDEACVSCSGDTVYSNAVAVGGAGGVSDPLIVLKTSDRFSSSATISTSAPSGSIGTSVFSKDNAVLVGFADKAKTAFGSGASTDPATGGVAFSSDGGATFALDTNITVSIFGVGYFNGQYIAAGGAGLGAAYVATSSDGTTWTQLTSSVLPSDEAVTSLAVDEVQGKLYLTCEGGTLLVGQENGGSVVFTDITADLPSAPSALWVVRALGDGHIAVGGASGFYAETVDDGATWTSPAVPGSNAVYGIAGSDYRALVGTGTKVYTRDILNKLLYTEVAAQNGVTMGSNIHDVAGTKDNDLNHFLAVAVNGEIYSIRHFAPYNY